MSWGEFCVYSDIDSAAEARIAQADKRPARRAEPDEQWVDVDTAARMLCISKGSFYTLSTTWPSNLIRSRSRSLSGRSGQGVGVLWSREDLVSLRSIRMECRLSIPQSLRVMEAVRDGRLFGRP